MKIKRALSLALVFVLLLSVQCISAFGAEDISEQVVLLGSFNNWSDEEMELSDGSVYTETLQLQAGNYLFKIKCGDTEFGHPGTILDTTSKVSAEGFMLSDSINAKCTLVATGGNYTFSFDKDTHMLKVIKDGEDTEDTEGDTLKIRYADTEVVAQVGDKVNYSVYLSADKLFEDIQSILNYNSKKLSLVKIATFDEADVTDIQAEAKRYCPNIPDVMYNSEHFGAVAVNASDINGYDFTSEKVLLTFDFEVISGGETALEFIVQEMTAADGDTYYTFSNKVSDGVVIREEMFVTETQEFPDNEVYGVSVILESDISLNFYYKLSEDVLKDERARVLFTRPNGSKNFVWVKDAAVSDGFYMFTCKVAAKEMASNVKVQLVSSSFKGDEFIYSVKTYGEAVLKGTEEHYEAAKPLVKAMLNYGAYAQEYFGYNLDTLANEGLSEDEKALADVDLTEYKHKLTGEETGVKYYGSKLSLESETAIKHYFIIDDKNNIPAFTVNGNEVTAVKKGNLYEVKIKGILAQNLDAPLVVKAGNLTLEYNALSYAELAMKTSETSLKNVMKALSIYNAEADNYIG